MAQGKKYNDDVREKAYALLAVNNNVQYVANELGLPYTTVRTWKNKWLQESAQSSPSGEKESEDTTVGGGEKSESEDDCEYNLAKLRNKKKTEFVEVAWGMIDNVTSLLKRRIDRALISERELDALLEELALAEDISDAQRRDLYKRFSALKLEDVRALGVLLGTLYDKQALANKEATAIIEGNLVVKKFEDF